MKIWNAAHNPIHNETHNGKWNGSSQKAALRRATRCEHCHGRHSSKRCPLARSVGGNKYYKKLLKELKNKSNSMKNQVRSGSGYAIHAMPGDGLCLYHCMIGALGRSGVAAARALRCELADWMVDNSGRVLGGLTVADWVRAEYNETVDQYARRMKAGRYGGALEMQAFSLKWVPVELYEETVHGLSHLWETGDVHGAAALRLVYRSAVHFDRVELL